MGKFSPILVVVMFASLGWQSPSPDVGTFDMKDDGLRITGPYAHENLAVYLIHAKKPGNREYITLDEGLEKGLVVVSENEQEQVGQLQIENRSDRPLFLQEGDRLCGGKQDRIIGLSMVVPPKSGKMMVRAFCVEAGRWSRGLLGKQFAMTDNKALAPSSVRFACKVVGNQGKVWREVAEQKTRLESQGVANNTSSLSEAIDSKLMKSVSDDYQRRLGGIFARHADAVGVAFALNSEVLEVDIYPGNVLLKKIAPRLLKGYAVQAIVARRGGVEHPEPSEIARFMTEGVKKLDRIRKINGRNLLHLVEQESKVVCNTIYQGQSVHLQWFARPQTAGKPSTSRPKPERAPIIGKRPAPRSPGGRSYPGQTPMGGLRPPPGFPIGR
ncbi:MAG: hypothetical protein O7H41_01770 [Planctomycetota bacterium]|nr:hypothetical protein [Planctomycetota bacterium]